MTKFSYAFFVFCLFFSNAYAQDIYIAQLYNNPMSVNPALTGAMNYDRRFTLQYKRWETVHKDELISLAYDRRFSLNGGDYWGIGVHAWRGEINVFGQSQLKTSVAYGKYLGGDGRGNAHYLLAGGEIGSQRSVLDLNREPFLAFTNYTNGNGFGFPIFQLDSLSVATGVLWCGNWKNGRRAHVGFAVHRVFMPIEAFTFPFYLPVKWRTTFHAHYELPLKPQMRLVPSIIYSKQGDYKDIRGGLALKITAQDTISLQLGASYRHARNLVEPDLPKTSLCLFMRVDLLPYSVNIAYDISLFSSVEFAFIYHFGDVVDKRYHVPTW